MKLITVFYTVITFVLLTTALLLGCQPKDTVTPTPSEPGAKPPIIFTTVPAPPSPTPDTMSSPTPASVTYILAVSISPSGAGTVALTPPDGNYPSGTVVTLTAVPTSGYKFDHWTGDVSGTSTVTTLTMDSNKNIVAYFK
jgi:hypothetical protein